MEPAYFALAAVLAVVLCPCQSYTLRGSVSWAGAPNDVADDADLSEEDAGLWKQVYPPSSVRGDSVESPGELVKSENDNVAQLSSSRLFSYRLEKVKTAAGSSSSSSPPPHQETARTARYIAHYSDWGHLATISTQDKVTRTEGRLWLHKFE